MYEFRHDYAKLKYSEDKKLCFMDNFIDHVKTEHI